MNLQKFQIVLNAIASGNEEGNEEIKKSLTEKDLIVYHKLLTLVASFEALEFAVADVAIEVEHITKEDKLSQDSWATEITKLLSMFLSDNIARGPRLKTVFKVIKY